MPSMNTMGSTDSDIDVPQEVRDEGAKVQAESFLKYTLGVEFKQTTKVIAEHIVDRIGSIRTSMTSNERLNLASLLDKKIDAAIKTVTPEPFHFAKEADKAYAISHAIQEVVPATWMMEFLQKAMPVEVSVRSGNMSRTLDTTPITINTIPNTVVTIDTMHPFWRNTKFKNETEVAKAIEGKLASEVGLDLNPPLVAPNDKIDAASAALIAAQKLNHVSLAKTRGSLEEKVKTAATPPEEFDLKVNLDALLRTKLGKDLPVSLAAKEGFMIAELTSTELVALLNHTSNGYWEKLVDTHGHNPNEDVTDGATPPVTLKLVDHAVNLIKAKLAPSGAGLGSVEQTIHEVGENIHDRLGTQKKLMDKLTKDTQNYMGAAMAAAMVNQDPSLEKHHPHVDTKKLEDDKAELTAKKNIYPHIDSLGAVTLDLQYPHTNTLFELRNEVTHLRADKVNIDGGGTSPWKSKGAPRISSDAPSVIAADKTKKAAVKAEIDKYLTEITADLAKYQKLIDQMINLKRELNKLSIDCDELNKYFTGPKVLTMNFAAFRNDMLAHDVAENVKNDLIAKHGFKEKAKLEHMIADLQHEIDHAAHPDVNGEDVQREIIEAYLKKNHPKLDEAGRESVIAHLQHKNICDHEFNKMKNSVIKDIFDQDSDTPVGDWMSEKMDDMTPFGSSSMQIVCKVSEMCGVKVDQSIEDWYYPVIKWPVNDYRTLCTAYFALKKLYEGKGPDRMNIRGTTFVKTQMKNLASLLVPRFLQTLERDLYAHLNEEDRQLLKDKHKQNKKLTMAEASEVFLTGDAPDAYHTRIDDVIRRADQRLYWKRDALSSVYNATLGSAPVAATASFAGGAIKESAKGLFEAVKNNPMKTAFFVGGSLLGGPILAGALLYMTKDMEGWGGAGGGGHDDHGHDAPGH